ncbi:MAG: GNAT family N-acetyltransferase [Clostridia bacterium]|nr:GNAT family N-acetyltransferase [Clostridia bacterium]
MTIRKAKKHDIPKLIDLLSQVLEIHASIRPDIFISGTTKHTTKQLEEMIEAESQTIYVAVDDDDKVVGYAFCKLREPSPSNNVRPFKSIMIDDLCIDASMRGKGVGKALVEHVKTEARNLGCYEIVLAVWEGNDDAKAFYEKMGMKPKETILEYVLD